jgi:hypothetical protein
MGYLSNSPINDRVRKARRNASSMETGIAARETVSRNAKAAGVNLSMAEERKAKKVVEDRIKIDRGRTAARAVAIEKIQEKKAAARRAAAATGNAPAKRKLNPGVKAAAKKAAAGMKKPAKKTTK